MEGVLTALFASADGCATVVIGGALGSTRAIDVDSVWTCGALGQAKYKIKDAAAVPAISGTAQRSGDGRDGNGTTAPPPPDAVSA
jgi:hypothetical protein